VTEFSKKTGDYTSLSATDIKVIALTYQLEKEKVGTQHLKNAPTVRVIQPINKSIENNSKLPNGFYLPKKKVRTIFINSIYMYMYMYVYIFIYILHSNFLH